MYRHLGGRFLLLASGASGVADVAVGTSQPRAVDVALKLMTAPLIVEIAVVLGLLAVVIGLRTWRLALRARRTWSASPASTTIRPTREDIA